ncbi:MAG: FAD-binding domain-containing protein [Burkholderiales bacterium]
MASLCWYRCDLRSADQPALTQAMQDDDAIALYVITPGQWRDHGDAPAKVDLWLRALTALQTELESLRVPLKILTVDFWSDIPAALLAFCREHAIDRVHCNREQGVNERKRDRACYALLREHGIAMTGHDAATLLEPGSVLTGAGSYYRVFTPFSRACRARLGPSPPRVLPTPSPQSPTTALPGSDPVPSVLPGWDQPARAITDLWPADALSVRNRLDTFALERMGDYHTNRDFPAINGTSSLSPYLASGMLSPGLCLHAALAVNQGEVETGRRGVTTWINEILWREFYQHLLHGFPALSMHQPMKPETNAVAWRDAPDDFHAWCEGRTGIPIVDAAMRQLAATGWMHNRLRMVAAMFLTKNLLIDWRQGEAFFMRHLIDGDLAANNGGWQWSASTGADAAPYFRVFNPVSQSERFDPQGEFIRLWVPELAALRATDIHNPPALARRALGYPDAMVDLRASRQRAIDAFASIR